MSCLVPKVRFHSLNIIITNTLNCCFILPRLVLYAFLDLYTPTPLQWYLFVFNSGDQFTGSQLSQLYGRATIESFETCAAKCVVSPGIDASLVKYGTEREVMVNAEMRCSCETFQRLKLCPHAIAVAKHNGPASVQKLISRSSIPTTSLQLNPGPSSGKKTGMAVRKGGRTAIPCPQSVDDAQYMVIRCSSRIKVCNGCRAGLTGERYVIRHCCRLPYKKRDDNGVLVSHTPSQPTNHHFHMNKRRVQQTHPNFNGKLAIDPPLSSARFAIRNMLSGSDMSIV